MNTTETHLPVGFPLSETSFYWAGGVVGNIKVGQKNGHPYVVFDYDTNTGETAHTDTVLAIKTESPKAPTTSLSRASGLLLERAGEWIFAFEPERNITPDKIDSVLDDVLKLLEYAKAFPQNL